MSNTYYKALDQPNADVVTEPIAEVGPRSITTADGTSREVDVIIYGTGFDTQAMASSVEIKGEGGQVLAEHWQRDGIQAHRGTMISGFPNLFFLLGPNTGLGHNSVVFMIECQIRLVVQAIAEARRRRSVGHAHALRPGRLQLEDAGRPRRRGLVSRLQELVPRRPGPEHHALAGRDLPLLRVDPKARPRRVRVGRAKGDAPAANDHRELAEVA